ncbi:MAG: glycosyltransferase [Candidatus Amulumruptor caecigallinarius]|nr:glycosyltransferase [Candidatus Amulumruptor caecigallinarius]MCM1396457.1 glycosyltransferase [Candidatus Amulumruptor caecigallinarius]MCM1453486.1 glycosyltransferase [bacterium]
MEDKRTMVSVLVPAYNAGGTLERLVKSLQAQTMTDWEAVVVDDASTDDTLAVARRLAAAEPRVRAFAMPQSDTAIHQGTPFLTRREAARHARGGYFCCLDADDYVEPRFLEKLLSRATETGADLVLCSVWWGNDDNPHGTLAFPTGEVNSQMVAAGREFIHHTLYFLHISLIGMLMERDIYMEVSEAEHPDLAEPYFDDLAARQMLALARRVALSDAAYHEVKHEGSLTSISSPRTLDKLRLQPAIDRFVKETFGCESKEYRLAALHSFAVWIDSQRVTRRMAAPRRAQMQQLADDAVLQLPMHRLRRLLSPRYLAIVEWHRLRARLRRASQQRLLRR